MLCFPKDHLESYFKLQSLHIEFHECQLKNYQKKKKNRNSTILTSHSIDSFATI